MWCRQNIQTGDLPSASAQVVICTRRGPILRGDMNGSRRQRVVDPIPPGREPQSHAPDQKPEVPDEHVPAQCVLVDRSGWSDHVPKDESTKEDVHPSIEDEDHASDKAGEEQQPPPDASAPRLDEGESEQSSNHFHQDDKDAQRDGGPGVLSSEILKRASNGVEQEGAAERPIEAHQCGSERQDCGRVCGQQSF